MIPPKRRRLPTFKAVIVFALPVFTVLVLTQGIFAQQKVVPDSSSAGAFDDLLKTILSREIVAVLLAAGVGYGFSLLSEMQKHQREREAEIGRLQFKQENFEANKAAVKEAVGLVQDQILDAIHGVERRLCGVETQVGEVERISQQALETAKIVKATQREWLEKAEAQIGLILSGDGNPTLVRLIEREDEEN